MLTQEMTKKISNILLDMGCTESYIFGSQATGKSVDLIDFDEKPQFFNLLQSLGELRKIG